ncbi:hypothetical protein IQ07DRAFT_591684 [Pyrenochaeta sp. DS3sAY3a]|nr:hypothetical protein IQ07DRAFT_591684 [Pyrenochaeta sp. DS3sAY3a]
MVAAGPSANRRWLQEGMIRSSMLGKTMLPGDEELGKKDDDHKFAPARRSPWSTLSHAPRWRRRRILLAVLSLLLVYLFFHSGGLSTSDDQEQRYHIARPHFSSSHDTYDAGSNDDDEPTGPPPGTPRPKRGQPAPRTYDGQIRFFRLAKTLRKAASATGGYEKHNRNVLFAVSSLKSASTLLPMICDMSKWKRSYVHVAFLGRDDLPLEDLLQINGIDLKSCPAVWHDARPDYMEYSSDTRAESAVQGAMSHIHSYLHPQVAIMDDSISEDPFFTRGMRAKTTKLGMPLFEIPKDRVEEFAWIARLDSGSLKNWHLPTVDILIQVPPDSSSVLLLLKSIKEADYSGLRPPRITLELPAELDESVKQHLANFKWPLHDQSPIAVSGLAIKKRILDHRANQEASSIRFLELFYPTSTKHSHVLLLSPQAQLSPQYFHFIKYALLEYKYSAFGSDDSENLMGVSLELPSVLLDAKTKLVPPMVDDMHAERYKELYPKTKSAPFAWQAPNSHATLFFGDKWVELHSFLSNRVSKHQKSSGAASRAKLVSETLPAWTEYMLEFMRARGYSLLYPAGTSETLVTIHNELYRAPEEFVPQPSATEASSPPAETQDEPFLRADEALRAPQRPESPVIPKSQALHLALPFNGDLPEVPHLPHLLYDGTKIHPSNVSTTATEYANKFREEVGGCKIPKGKHRKIVAGEARDLFCFGDEEKDDWEDDEIEQGEVYQAMVEEGFKKNVTN